MRPLIIILIMKKNIAYYLLLAISCAALVTSATAQDVSRAEFMALAQRLEEVEAALQVVSNTQVQAIATEAVAAMPMNLADKNSLIESVVNTIQVRQESANFPWMDADKWARVVKGMSPDEVVAILEDPTLDEPSMHKRIDFVYTYQGRRVATAKKVSGVVRFYKGIAVEIEAPEL